jgi:hypothetical protein
MKWLNEHRQKILKITEVAQVGHIIQTFMPIEDFRKRILTTHDEEKKASPELWAAYYTDPQHFDASPRDFIRECVRVQKNCPYYPAYWDDSYTFSLPNQHCGVNQMPPLRIVEYALDLVVESHHRCLDPIEVVLEEPVSWSADQIRLLLETIYAADPEDRPWPSAEAVVEHLRLGEESQELQYEAEWQMGAIDHFSVHGKQK